MIRIDSNYNPFSFRDEVDRLSGQKVENCIACGKCSSGCVIAPFMDLFPHEVMKLISMGREKEVLSSKTIWLCVSCEACTTRCPEGIDIARVMDTLRKIALEKGYTPSEKDIYNFNKAFLNTIEKFGRIFELGFIMDFYRRGFSLFRNIKDNIDLGLGMLNRGKLPFKPHSVSDKVSIKRCFEKAKRFIEEGG